VLDLERGSRVRLSLAGRVPLWNTDGTEVSFWAVLGGTNAIFSAQSDGSAEPQHLVIDPTVSWGVPGSWTSDGGTLAFHAFNRSGNRDILLFSPERDSSPRPLLDTPFQERNPAISPGGQWLAYTSDESGRDEVYVQAFPGPGGKFSVSTEGGIQPVWSPNGRELFYREGYKMMVVDVETSPAFRASTPRVLFEGNFATGNPHNPNYSISPDGQRFLMVQDAEAPQFKVVLNWDATLESLRDTR
jgi:serine/threonine-protein kinase